MYYGTAYIGIVWNKNNAFEKFFIAWRYVYNITWSEKSNIEAIHRVWFQFGRRKIYFQKEKNYWKENTKILITIALEQWDYDLYFLLYTFFYFPNFNNVCYFHNQNINNNTYLRQSFFINFFHLNNSKNFFCSDRYACFGTHHYK